MLHTIIPKNVKNRIIHIGQGAGHSFTIGATIVTALAIIPHVPTEVFLLLAGNILSSVKEIYVVAIKLIIMPNFKSNIRNGIKLSSNLSLDS